MKAKSSLILALVAGVACSAMAGEGPKVTKKREAGLKVAKALPVTAALKSARYDLRTGEFSVGAGRTGTNLVWDSYSVYTGFYTVQDNPASGNAFCPVNPDLGTQWVNAGDLPNGTLVDCFQYAYYAPGVAGACSTCGVSGFGSYIEYYSEWSERRDACIGGQPTGLPPVLQGGYLITGLPAGSVYAWILTVPIGGTFSFTLSGADEDCDLDPSTNPDWGWGLTWEQLQAVPGTVGPLICDAGTVTGSSAEGATNRWSVYNSRPLTGPCVDLWFGGTPWADFWMGLWNSDTGCTADCDNDGVCDGDETDCDGNGVPDDCEVLADCNNNGIPDDCDPNHCPCDLTGEGNLNVFDFLEFQTLFGNGEICADFTGEGSLNVFDFLEFQTCFGNGC